jgi:putative tryptophan/tyrosine transport system substrate-binding protein
MAPTLYIRRLGKGRQPRAVAHERGGIMRTFVGGTFRGLARLTVTLVISMAAIAGASPVQAKNLRIAMILWHPETPAEAGFKDELKKLGYTADYVVIDAHQDRTALRSKIESEILPQLKSFDYVYSYGTTVTQVTKVLLGGRAQQLFDIVYDPVGAGFVESLTASGGNITGASDAVPLSAQFKPFLKQFKIKKLAVLFNPREKNSNQQLQGLQQAAKNYGFDVIELPSPPALDRLQQNLKSLADGQVKVDAVYLPAE